MDLPRHSTSTWSMPYGSSKSKECNINRVFDNATIPGYGVTLEREPCPADHHLYRGSFAHWHAMPLTLREIAMMTVMNQLMEKPEWHKKIFDKVIVDKWRAEARCLADFSEKMWQYCVAELRYKADRFEETGIVVPIDFDSQVLYSDGAIGRQIIEKLVTSVAPLENVPDNEKDWHPGSHGQVLDLIHPSLFPLVFGRSKVLKQNVLDLESCISQCGHGQTIQTPPEVAEKKLYWRGYVDNLWSQNYQWLPCEVDISDKNNAKIVSYINNLHPDVHKSLYCAIEDVITRSLPLWAGILGSFDFQPPSRRIEFHDIAWTDIPDETCSEGSQRSDELYENPASNARPQSPISADSTDEYFCGEEYKILVKPEPQDFSPHDREFRNCTTGTRRGGSYGQPAPPLNLLDDYRQLQVIVKLANIQLTPDKPEYPGGSWHVEGQLNEHIVVSSLLYYDQHNIGPSYLAFRHNVDTKNETQDFPSYGQGEFAHFEDLMGIMNEEDASQELGQVLTKEGRLLVFPNVLHHRVPPFSLQDPSKPGHRKILAIFLVDPHLKILSTAHVPPQQLSWWAAELLEKQKNIRGLDKLPAEVMNQIIDEVDGFPMSLEEAKQIRLDLMRERTRNVTKIINERAVQYFNFCEH